MKIGTLRIGHWTVRPWNEYNDEPSTEEIIHYFGVLYRGLFVGISYWKLTLEKN